MTIHLRFVITLDITYIVYVLLLILRTIYHSSLIISYIIITLHFTHHSFCERLSPHCLSPAAVMKSMDAELIQKRRLVGGGPSLKTWPKWALQQEQVTSVRIIPGFLMSNKRLEPTMGGFFSKGYRKFFFRTNYFDDVVGWKNGIKTRKFIYLFTT